MIELAGVAFGPPTARVAIPVGGITVLIGTNDAGKSTLLEGLRECMDDLALAGEMPVLDDECPWIHLRAPAALLGPYMGFAEIQAMPKSSGQQDVIVELRAEPRVNLAAPAGIVRQTPELASAAALRGVDLAAYPDTFAVPLVEIDSGALGPLRRRLPLVLKLPAPASELDQRLLESIEFLIDSFTAARNVGYAGHLRKAGVEGLDDDRLRYWRQWFGKRARNPWLFPRLDICDGQEETHPDIAVATAMATSLIARALPDFVGTHYTIEVIPTPLSTWVRGGSRVWIAARRKGSRSEPFPADSIAEGFRLWTQLAVLEASEALMTLGDWLEEVVSDPPVDAPESRQLDAWQEDVEPLVEPLRRLGVFPIDDQPSIGDIPALTDELVRACSPMHDAQGPDELAREGRSVAILDEPERHLHPSLQRAAAMWLESRSVASGATFVIASHSVAFMGLDPSAHFLYVRRDHQSRPIVTPMDPTELSAADAVADDLGLDRGELLALVRKIVFVEGTTDRAFIEALYGPELRQSGIVIVPLAGAKNLGSMVPISELLLRFTSAPALVIVDDLPRETIHELQSDSMARKEAMRSKKIELRELAKLMQVAIEAERSIVCEAITVKDIFDFIDEGVVRDVLATPGNRVFPGHEEARGLGVESKWKSDYQQRYGLNILDERTFADGGAEMRRRGLDVPELRSLLGV